MAEAPNYWPPIARVRPGPTPELLLRQQADLLTEQTGGVLQGKVDIGSRGEWITLDLLVVAPALDDYTFRLLKVRHKPVRPFDPVEFVNGSKPAKTNGSEAYERKVADLLGSPDTAALIGELLALSQRATATTA